MGLQTTTNENLALKYCPCRNNCKRAIFDTFQICVVLEAAQAFIYNKVHCHDPFIIGFESAAPSIMERKYITSNVHAQIHDDRGTGPSK